MWAWGGNPATRFAIDGEIAARPYTVSRPRGTRAQSLERAHASHLVEKLEIRRILFLVRR